MTGFATYPSLKARNVLVTGGASGIGAAIVAAFVGQGARVSFLDVDVNAAERLLSELRAEMDAPLQFIPCDVTDTDALLRAVTMAGPLDVLINNAGRDTRTGLADLDRQTWDDLQAVNLRHVVFATQAAWPGMASRGGGAVVNFGSPTFRRKRSGIAAYAAAKAGVEGVTRVLAAELGGDNIRVNAVMPGWTLTERQRTLWLTAEEEEKLMAAQCLKRFVMPDDVARLVLFLSADDSASMTAQVHIVDGGLV